jgi:hypothetical protein
MSILSKGPNKLGVSDQKFSKHIIVRGCPVTLSKEVIRARPATGTASY